MSAFDDFTGLITSAFAAPPQRMDIIKRAEIVICFIFYLFVCVIV
ncbi:hypothetical protein GJA_2551 [Janthinobacterium agaricidamnosum NBRC 102515 = DSM 9628]|uniref:Uncharacterized protein n=1 Tax=Janthinobacterium agaricidamnosum NBRC 102515 = DSM 9628 TaxID=1349767 RepID=W0V7D7_9BURK|nr:hypothetical protein GJA_2551 [Janthinobacterium agaricidamnosum NBRC 102515 = DSM 9628]